MYLGYLSSSCTRHTAFVKNPYSTSQTEISTRYDFVQLYHKRFTRW